MAMIEIKNVSKWYSETFQVLKKCSATVNKGEVVVVCGPSGSGKSTLIKTVNGLEAFQEGEIFVNGINVGDPKTDLPRLRTHIGMVFQRPNPFSKSIYENITFALKENGIKDKEKLAEIVETSLKQAALWDEVKDDLNKSALALSGGQQQRLCIARAIAMKPDILLLDEPASALDPISTAKIEETLLELKEKYTLISVTHNMQQASRISDYTAFFHLGNVIEYNKTKNIFTNPKIKLTEDYISGNFG